jgi:hypothetical protein
MAARDPKSGLPDFGTEYVEIGNSRFRSLAAILRDARKSALLRMRCEYIGLSRILAPALPAFCTFSVTAN